MNENDESEEGKICQSCHSLYYVDLNVPEEVWEKIKPEDETGESGLLCGGCTMDRVEAVIGTSTWTLVKQ